MRFQHLMQRCLMLWFVMAASVCTAQISVVDETGATVHRYEVMWHTAGSGCSEWKSSWGGEWEYFDVLTRDASVVDVLVRADGYATSVRRFEADSLAELRAGKATLSVSRGHKVQLKLNLPAGMEVPESFFPQVYFSQFAYRTRAMSQPSNFRSAAMPPDFNMLNVSRHEDGVFFFRISREHSPFYVAFQHPGWLRFHEVGPLSSEDVKNGVIEIDVPRPVTIQVTLNIDGADETELPFKDAGIQVDWPSPDNLGTVYRTSWNERISPGETRVFSDLGPGELRVSVRTNPRAGVEDLEDSEINPGRFFAEQEITVAAGDSHTERFQWTPFDAKAHRGESQARLELLKPDGLPAAGMPLKVDWFDGHYGTLNVFNGQTPEDGIVRLDHISSELVTETPYGPYIVELDGDSVGWFQLQPTTDIQEFEFRMVPDIGDRAPDIEFVDARTSEVRRLADFHGQVVLLEFWGTWCGPCQPAMQKLNEMVAENPGLAGKVAIVPLSVDRTRELVIDHVDQRGWTALRHFWTRPYDEGLSQAGHAFVVHGVPTAILLKPDGTIAWRGHPLAAAGGVSLQSRIESLLDEE